MSKARTRKVVRGGVGVVGVSIAGVGFGMLEEGVRGGRGWGCESQSYISIRRVPRMSRLRELVRKGVQTCVLSHYSLGLVIVTMESQAAESFPKRCVSLVCSWNCRCVIHFTEGLLHRIILLDL